MDRRTRLLHAMPTVVLLGVIAADLVLGENVVIGLVVMAPLLAGSLVSPRVTAGYAVVALVAAALLGIVDGQYTQDARSAQTVRLVAVTVGGIAAVLAAQDRVARERRLVAMTRVADVAQRAILLPVPSPLGGVEVAVHYESAASEAMLGGDLYGAVDTGDRLRLVVGDVRGKGLDAVRVAAQVLAAFRERAGEDGPLHLLAEHLDATVARIGAEEDFVTAVLVEIVGGRRVQLVNAGHPEPLLTQAGRVSAVIAHEPAPPLGLGGARVTGAPLDLGTDGRLLLYTDGLIEARRPRDREFLPQQRIEQTLLTSSGVAGDVEGLRDLLLGWVGGRPRDDVALVSLAPCRVAP